MTLVGTEASLVGFALIDSGREHILVSPLLAASAGVDPNAGHVGIDGFALQRRWATLYQASSEDERPQVVAAYRMFSGGPDAAAKRMLASVRSTPLLHLADEVVRHHGLPRGEPVCLQGDVWPGNLLWIGDRCVGLIDWKEAGVGHSGVDLANLRFQLAMQHGADAAVLVLEGWEDEMGRKATDVAYWDAVAALNTPTDLDALDRRLSTSLCDAWESLLCGLLP